MTDFRKKSILITTLTPFIRIVCIQAQYNEQWRHHLEKLSILLNLLKASYQILIHEISNGHSDIVRRSNGNFVEVINMEIRTLDYLQWITPCPANLHLAPFSEQSGAHRTQTGNLSSGGEN